jgi:hypothetical protein
MAVMGAAIVLALTGCSGDVSRATITLGESDQFSRTEIQAAADVVLAEFGTFRGCTLLRLTYDEEFSTRQGSLSWAPPPEGDDVLLLTSDFAVDWTGGDGSLTPNSTYTGWTWEVTRTGPEAPWTVTNRGVA